MSRTDTSAPETLAAKLARIRKALRRVPKNGYNADHDYHYALAADVLKKARRQLDREGILVVPMRDGEVAQHGGLTVVPLAYRFIDTESGEELDVPWVGAGYDRGGSTGTYKAFTGAMKYLLLNVFMVETLDDPEASSRPAPNARGADVPTIPRSRAERIARRIAEEQIDRPVIEAKLADLGARRLLDLNVDQAEALERFIDTETERTPA